MGILLTLGAKQSQLFHLNQKKRELKDYLFYFSFKLSKNGVTCCSETVSIQTPPSVNKSHLEGTEKPFALGFSHIRLFQSAHKKMLILFNIALKSCYKLVKWLLTWEKLTWKYKENQLQQFHKPLRSVLLHVCVNTAETSDIHFAVKRNIPKENFKTAILIGNMLCQDSSCKQS